MNKFNQSNAHYSTKRSFKMSLVIVFALVPMLVLAQMSSSNYSIPADSINFGGQRSSSVNYGLEDTLGEVATGFSDSANFELRAGYQQLDIYPISISTTGDVTLPSIGGVSTNASSASMTTTVETQNPTGYELSIKTTTSPAMQSGTDYFSDYIPAGSNPDYNFTLGSGEDGFGYSVEGTDTVSRFLDNGSNCNVGTGNVANKCWDGLSTSDELIASRNSSTSVSGEETDVVFKAGIGPGVIKSPGNYTATIEVTAVTL